MSLTTCLKKAGDFVSAEDRAAIQAGAHQLRKEKQRPSDAGLNAVKAQLALAETDLAAAFEADRTGTAPVRAAASNIKAADFAPVFRSPISEIFAKSALGKTTLGQRIQDTMFDLNESPMRLPWITNDQIAEGYGHLRGLQDMTRASARMGRVANQYLETAVQIAKHWRALDAGTAGAMQDIMLSTTMDRTHVSIKDAGGKYLAADAAWAHASNNHLERKPALRAKFDKNHAAFMALSPAAKSVHDSVRDDLTRQHNDQLAGARKSIVDSYATQLKRLLTPAETTQLAASTGPVKDSFSAIAQVAGTAQEQRALAGLRTALKDLNSEFGTIKGPYFPLVRFGDHVAVLKSSGLNEIEAQLNLLRDNLQEAINTQPEATEATAEAAQAKVDDLRASYAKQRETLDKLKQDDREYRVEFFEKPHEAEAKVREWQAAMPNAEVYRSIKEEYHRGLDGASPAFLKQLQENIAASLDKGTGVSAEARAKTLQGVKDMYLRQQPERSALRSELARGNIAGVQSGQMLRGYAQAARNGSWRISRLRHGSEMVDGLARLSDEKRDPQARYVLNEMKARMVGDFAVPTDNKFLQGLGSATYFMHLGFNMSYYLTNATQAWITSLPVMAGRHGIAASTSALSTASRDVLAGLKDATAQSIKENGVVVGMQLRLTDEQIAVMGKTDGERAMLKELTDDGVIDITIKHDLGALSDGTANGAVSGPLSKMMEISGALANYPEMYNRLSTSLAAYRMEVQRTDGDADAQAGAVKYAAYIINRTHFNYSPENAPRMMRGDVGRLIFQFKRYQQGMIYLFASHIKKAYGGDVEAGKSLVYLLGMNMAVGGVTALPIAAPIALIASLVSAMYPDDDEPEFLQSAYNGMKDGVGETLAQALVKGLPTLAGLDVSQKIGAGNLLNPVGFAQTGGMKPMSRDYFKEIMFSLGGAGMAVVGRELDAAEHLTEGRFLKAAEAGTPVFIANALKAYAQDDRGMTNKRGDVLMDASEFGFAENSSKALGFQSVKVSDMYQNRSTFLQMSQDRKEARASLLNTYYQAVRSKDSDAMASARVAIDSFNERQKTDPIKARDLAASVKSKERLAQQMRGGLRVTPRDEQTYGKLLGE